MTSTVLSAIAGSASRSGSTCSCRKNSGKASQTKSALAQISSSQSRQTAAQPQRRVGPGIEPGRIRGVPLLQDGAQQVDGGEHQREPQGEPVRAPRVPAGQPRNGDEQQHGEAAVKAHAKDAQNHGRIRRASR